MVCSITVDLYLVIFILLIDVQGIYLFTSGVPDQPQDVAVSYVEEASSGKSLKLHSILFNVDDYDANGAIPSRYANITRTAECLRNMAHASRGRFHWFRETGPSAHVSIYLYEHYNLELLESKYTVILWSY